MANLSVTQEIRRRYKSTSAQSGTGGGWGKVEAVSDAQNKGNNAVESWGGFSSTSWDGSQNGYIIGGSYGAKTVTTGIPQSTQLQNEDGDTWWNCSYTVGSRQYQQWENILSFSVPSQSINTIDSVNLTFTLNSDDYLGNQDFYICILTASSSIPTGTTKPYISHTSDILDQTNRVTFTGNTTRGATYTINVTDIFKLAVQRNKLNFLIIQKNENGGYGRINSISINYTLGITACTPPTSIYLDNNSSLTSAIKAPINEAIHLYWSGAADGNNNPITKYRIYWDLDQDPVIGSISSNGGFVETSNTTTNFTIPAASLSGATMGTHRGSTYKFKVAAYGQELVNNGHLSTLSTAKAEVKINNLPGAPTVILNKTKVPSTGGTVTITTCTPGGNNGDSSQTHTVKYTINNETTYTNAQVNTSLDVNNTTTYKFWTYDGLEYSSTSTNITVTKGSKPIIGSITLAPNSGTASSNTQVLNIKGSATGVSNGVTYNWRLRYVSSNTAPTISNSTLTPTISSSTSFSNYNVTTNGDLTFGDRFKLSLVVTDNDTGEQSDEKLSETYYKINDTSEISSLTLYNSSDGSNKSYTNTANFEDYISVVITDVEANNTVIKKLICNDSITLTLLNTGTNNINIAATYGINRGAAANLSVEYSLGQLKTKIITLGTLTRAKDAKMAIETSPTVVNGYSGTSFTCIFSDPGVRSWRTGTSPNYSYPDNVTGLSNYQFILKNGSQTLTPSVTLNSGPDSTGIISFNFNINNITSSQWYTFFGNTYPYGEQQITMEFSVKNNFQNNFTTEFTNSTSIKFNFSENLDITSVTVTTNIETNTNEYTQIPAGSHNYLLFPNQTLQFVVGNIFTYIQKDIQVELIFGSNVIKTYSITPSSYSTSNRGFTFGFTITYTLPFSLFNAKANVDFKIRIQYKNLTNSSQTIQHSNLSNCKVANISADNIIPKIINLNNDASSLTYYCNFPISNNELISNIFNAITGQIKTSENTQFSNDFTIAINNNSFNDNKTLTITPVSSPTEDLYYLILKITFTFKVQTITVNNSIKTPTGTKTFTASKTIASEVFTFYRTVPNLLYGKNFFVINASHPKMNGNNEVADQLLVIRSTGTHNKIYFGKDDSHESSFEINEDYGLIIDGGSWN